MKNKKLIYVIAALALSISILSYLNLKSMNIGADDSEKGILFLKLGSKEEKVELETVKSLPGIEFDAIQDTSTTGPEKHHFKGILLKDLLLKVEPEFESLAVTKIVVKGLDGYSVALGKEEIIDKEDIFLVYERDGKPLGSKRTGGSGPYQLIARQDAFSMRWCKFVSEVVAE